MSNVEQLATVGARDIQQIRESEFPVTRERRFFNHAACSPLPLRAARAMEKQIHEHTLNGNLGNPVWSKNREEARRLAGQLMNADPHEIAFVGNTADGLSIVANGFRWRPGDNVVTTNVEYPANMYPWMNLASRGVVVKTVAEKRKRIELADVAAAIDARTRVLSISWVEFASGFKNDLVALGALCRERGVFFVVDAIQALGAFPIDVKAAQIGVLASGGQKWLLGPRGCGLVYCSQSALEQIDPPIAGVFSVADEHNLLNYKLDFKPNARRFEYGTENAVGLAGIRGSLELLAEVGIEFIQERILELTGRFCEGARAQGYTIDSSRREGEASALVFFHKEGKDVEPLAGYLAQERFVLSVRDGGLRFAPHFYNTPEEVDALISALRSHDRNAASSSGSVARDKPQGRGAGAQVSGVSGGSADTFSGAIAANARKFGSKQCILPPEKEGGLTYEALDAGASRFAGFLLEQGVPRAGRLLIAIHNLPEFFIVLLGAMRAGTVAIPVDSGLGLGELEKIIGHADPQAIVVNETSLQKLSGVNPSCKRILFGASALPGVVSFDPGAAGPERAAPPKVDPSELALILYTSGTTGLPKGVMHSHAGIAAKLETIREWFSLDSSNRSLCMLPTHFGHGLICNCLAALYYGGSLVLCRPFDLDLIQKLWGYVEKNNVNTFSTVPAIVRLLLRVAERTGPIRVPSLRFVTCASAPLRVEDVEAFEKQFGVPLLNCYGITETASWTAFSPREEKRDRASVGTAFRCDIRTVDDSGKPLPVNEPGELQIRGPSVMLGYYKNPEATAQAIKDGWFSSGDHGRVDESGRVFILGRIKELIIRAGLNVYPPDIDAILLTHAGVEEAYTVGLEDAMLGEKVAAAVVRKPGSTLTENELIVYCRGHLAPYKCPERIAFVDAIPKTSRGKVNRANLRPLFTSKA